MFWGLIMEPQKRYSQVIKKAFHISMASLDISNSDNQPAQVLCGYDGKNYLLCTLQKPDKLQCNLDLYFEEGCSVSFASNGKSHIHLTGYLTKDEEALDDISDEEEDEELDVKPKRNVRSREGSEKQSPRKKIKLEQLLEEHGEEESDDSDFNIDELMEAEDSGGSEEEEDDEDMLDDEAEDTGDEDDSEEDGEEGEEEEDEDEEELKVEEEKVVQNGLSKKSKKIKKEEEPSTPTKKSKQNKEKPQLTPGPKIKKEKPEEQKKGKEEKKAKENQQSPKKKTLPNGLVIEDLKVGQGDVATNGKFIHVYYEGRLKSNNKVFDKSLNGPGFGFRLGKGEVIKGWDSGINGMKVGGKRRITCPPQTAYGAKGSPPVIPPNSTLVFEVELKKIK